MFFVLLLNPEIIYLYLYSIVKFLVLKSVCGDCEVNLFKLLLGLLYLKKLLSVFISSFTQRSQFSILVHEKKTDFFVNI